VLIFCVLLNIFDEPLIFFTDLWTPQTKDILVIFPKIALFEKKSRQITDVRRNQKSQKTHAILEILKKKSFLKKVHFYHLIHEKTEKLGPFEKPLFTKRKK